MALTSDSDSDNEQAFTYDQLIHNEKRKHYRHSTNNTLTHISQLIYNSTTNDNPDANNNTITS